MITFFGIIIFRDLTDSRHMLKRTHGTIVHEWMSSCNNKTFVFSLDLKSLLTFVIFSFLHLLTCFFLHLLTCFHFFKNAVYCLIFLLLRVCIGEKKTAANKKMENVLRNNVPYSICLKSDVPLLSPLLPSPMLTSLLLWAPLSSWSIKELKRNKGHRINNSYAANDIMKI